MDDGFDDLWHVVIHENLRNDFIFDPLDSSSIFRFKSLNRLRKAFDNFLEVKQHVLVHIFELLEQLIDITLQRVFGFHLLSYL